MAGFFFPFLSTILTSITWNWSCNLKMQDKNLLLVPFQHLHYVVWKFLPPEWLGYTCQGKRWSDRAFSGYTQIIKRDPVTLHNICQCCPYDKRVPGNFSGPHSDPLISIKKDFTTLLLLSPGLRHYQFLRSDWKTFVSVTIIKHDSASTQWHCLKGPDARTEN